MDLTHSQKVSPGTDVKEGTPAPSPERTLLFVGPEGAAPVQQAKERGLEIKCVESYLQARYWLEKVAESSLPYAIICELEWTRQADLALAEVIRDNPVLRRVPFILVSPDNRNVDYAVALEMGVDDAYRTPFSWDDVFRRAEFLRQFKRELNLGNPAVESRFDGRIPTAKRLFDITVSSVLLLMLSPLMLLIAVLIKLESKGPVFYISKRAGSGYDIFDFYKFRSMRVGADAELAELSKEKNQYEEGTFIKIEDDPRITRIGRFIRNTSLDELPQLFNVLKGDMSVVGNRPLPLYEASMLTTDQYAGRFLAPAGITGLWQVTKRGGNDMSVSERIALDIEYANKYSLLYDLQLIVKTIPALLQQQSV
jgi:lipopolysaccharide/colanic/teichoic acid biosynthesis glycosyltransferase